MGRGKGSTAPSYTAPGAGTGATQEQLDDDVRSWLADPAIVVPVHATEDHGRAGEPVWATEAHRKRYARRFDLRHRAGAERGRLLREAVAAGRGVPVDLGVKDGWRAYPLPRPDAARIQREAAQRHRGALGSAS